MMSGFALLTLGVLFSLALTGCGGSADDDGTNGSGGAGIGASSNGGSGNTVAPPTANCEDFCALLVGCVASLCEEDLGRSFPDELVKVLDTSCSTSCTEELIREKIAPKWDCFVENSCRAIFADDVCQADSSYHCAG